MPCLISTGGHLLEFRKFPSRFGTRADNELCVQEGMGVAAHHFTLRREGVRIVLESTGQGATTVNGNDVRRANIRDGDRIQVGQLMLIYSNPSGQQNHYPERSDANEPIGLPAPVSTALPAPASEPKTSRVSETKPTTAPVHQMAPTQKMPVASAGVPSVAASSQAIPSAQVARTSTSQVTQSAVPPDTPLSQNQPFTQAAQQPVAQVTAGLTDPSTPLHQETAKAVTPIPVDPVSRTVPEGIPTVSETTPSDSFLAWAKQAEESPIAAPVSAILSAKSAGKPEQAAHQPQAAQQVNSAQSPQAATPASPFANAVVSTPNSDTKRRPSPAETAQSPRNPFNSEKEDLASIFTQAEEPDNPPNSSNEPDLASIFSEADDPVPKVQVPVPAIPDISEAEKVGAIAEANQLPSKDINPIGSIINKGKQAPTPPPPQVPVETKPTEPLKKTSLRDSRKATKKVKSKRKPDTESMAGRLSNPRLQPKYKRQIPWPKIAVFLCLVFAAAGAYLATSGQAYVDKYMAMLGLKSDPAHHNYLPRFAKLNPNMILTADADRVVEFYREWAAEENWKTVGDIETKLKEWAAGFRLSDLEHISIATNDSGQFVALVSTKSNLDRQQLMRDLGKGVLVSARVGVINVHEGFVGSRQPVKFAILNPKTMVIGDPAMTVDFISETKTGIDPTHPASVLSQSPKDLLGLYHTRRGLDSLADWFSGPLRPSIDRLLGFIRSDASEDHQLLAQIGGDLRITGSFKFDEGKDAESFAKSWRERAGAQLGMLEDLLGPKAPHPFAGLAPDLEQMTITTPGTEVRLSLVTTNRWATLGSIGLKDSLVHLVESLQNRLPKEAPGLLSPEETNARMIAQQIVEKFDLARAHSSPTLKDMDDVESIVNAISRGARGAGVYRNVVHRVAGVAAVKERLMQLLKWDGERLIMEINAPHDQPAAMLVEDSDEDES